MLKGPNQQNFLVFELLLGIVVLGFSALLCFRYLAHTILQ